MPEQFLIDHCSPTLAGLKTANMFPVSLDEDKDIEGEVRKLNRILHEKGIRVLVLRSLKAEDIAAAVPGNALPS